MMRLTGQLICHTKDGTCEMQLYSDAGLGPVTGLCEIGRAGELR